MQKEKNLCIKTYKKKVIEIRESNLSNRELSVIYGVNKSSIQRVKSGKTGHIFKIMTSKSLYIENFTDFTTSARVGEYTVKFPNTAAIKRDGKLWLAA